MMDLNTAIAKYLKRGFGSMNKNDFEVWIFFILLQNELKDKSNYEISIKLKLPESKVKRLKYEAELKYGTPEDTVVYNDTFEQLLKKVVLKKDGSSIQFVVEDIQLRKYLDSVLKKGGRFSNTSFNSEIVSIDLDDLEYLLKELFPDKWNVFYNKAQKKTKDKGSIIKKLLNATTISAAKELGKQVIDVTIDGLTILLGEFINILQ